MTMEREIGEIFDYDGVKLEVIEHVGCNGCYFDNSQCTGNISLTGYCSVRSDKKCVQFRKVE